MSEQTRFVRRARAARRRRRLPWLLGLVAVLVLAGGAYAVYFSRVLSVRAVEVDGRTTLADARVEKAAAVPMGEPLARADLAVVRRRVEALPQVDSVEVTRAWPHAVRVTVTDRVPVAVVATGTGWRTMDADGVEWGHSSSRPAGLPVVRPAPQARDTALREAATVVSSLPAGLTTRIAAVDVATIDRITFTLDKGPSVTWGSADDSRLKARVLTALLGSKEARRVDGAPAGRVDVSVPSQPTVSQ